MVSHKTARLSPRELISVLAEVAYVGIASAVDYVANFVTGRRPRWPIRTAIAVFFLQRLLERPFQLRRKVTPTTGEAVKGRAEAQGLAYTRIDLPSSGVYGTAALHRVTIGGGSGKQLLYFHGGGFVLPATGRGHVTFAIECARHMNADYCYFLEYSLAPETPYPGQLVQAVGALQFLLGEYKLSQITLMGDSAGGNLSLGLISHLKGPSPYAPRIDLSPGDRFRDVVLISPLITTKTTSQSFPNNNHADYIRVLAMRSCHNSWTPTAEEVWAEPLTAPAGFWQDIPVRAAMIIAGECECFRDDIKAFARSFGAGEKASSSRQLVIVPGVVHEQCIIDYACLGKYGVMGEIITKRMAELR